MNSRLIEKREKINISSFNSEEALKIKKYEEQYLTLIDRDGFPETVDEAKRFLSDLNRSVISDDLMLPERKVPTSVQKLFSAEKPKMQTRKASRSLASTSDIEIQEPKKLWQLPTRNIDPFDVEFSEIPEGLREFQFNKYYKKVMNNMNEPSLGPKVRDLEVKWHLDDIKRLKVYLKKGNWNPRWQSYLGGKDYSDLLDEVSRLEKDFLKKKRALRLNKLMPRFQKLKKF